MRFNKISSIATDQRTLKTPVSDQVKLISVTIDIDQSNNYGVFQKRES